MRRPVTSIIILLLAVVALAGWKPPSNPDPNKILAEARADYREQRYADALAKQVWFHQNALKYDKALYGVRLSFALSDWHRLGLKYQPALDKLRSIRDAAEKKVKDGTDPYHYFHDFASINRELEENGRTVSLFKWLDVKAAPTAKMVYNLAQPALLQAKEYSLCGKYIDPNEYYGFVDSFKRTKNISGMPGLGAKLMDFAKNNFSNEVSTLVALLVINGRKKEALTIVASAKNEWNDPKFHAALDKALRGTVPEVWP